MSWPKVQYLLPLILTGLLWIFVISKLPVDFGFKHVIFPIVLFVILSVLINGFFGKLALTFVSNKLINKLTTKCEAWQEEFSNICDDVDDGKCIIDIDDVLEWPGTSPVVTLSDYAQIISEVAI